MPRTVPRADYDIATMARILVTGSTDGIGLETARTLQGLGHDVVFHARSEQRAAVLPDKPEVLVADLADLEQTRAMGRAAGAFDAVIHNAGIGGQDERPATPDRIQGI